MPMIARERPGVYSDYESSGLIFSAGGKKVGIIARALGEVGRVYNVGRVSDASAIFGDDNQMTRLCEIALANGAYNIAAVSAGESGDNYELAFTALESQDGICAVMCDSTDQTTQLLLKKSVVRASENLRERVAIIAAPQGANLKEYTAAFNCERVVIIAQNTLDDNAQIESSCILTAALAGVIAQNTDPSRSFNGVSLQGISRLESDLSEDDVDLYIRAGVTPFEVIAGRIEIIRAVTSKTTSGTVADRMFKELNTVLVIDDVIRQIRDRLKVMLPSAKNNFTTRSSIASQAILVLQEYLDAAVIDDYAQPSVYASAQDPSVCVLELKFTVSIGLNQIHVSANIMV